MDQLDRAQTLIAEGNVDQARGLLAEHCGFQECAVRLRELLIGEGLHAQAEPVVRELANGTGPESGVSRAILAFQSGDLQSTLRECQAALSAKPDLATAHNHAGRALHNLGNTPKALDAFRRATELDKNYPEAWHNLGHALRASGDMAAAVNAYQNAIKLAPAYRSAMQNLGITLFHMDRVNEALVQFRMLLKHDPDDTEALVGAGLCLQLLGQIVPARKSFERAIELDPANATAHCYLGILFNELAEIEAAINSLETALKLDPGDVEAWIELASVYEQSNRLDDANRAVKRGLAVEAGHPGLHIEAAKLERQQGQSSNAVSRLRRIDPRHLPGRVAQQYFFELGHALDRNNEADEAVQAFTSAKRIADQSVRGRGIDRAAFGHRCQDIENWLKTGAPGSRPQDVDPQDDLGEDLCFLVGFNRSGTTLIDTMLATNPAVTSIEESATLEYVIAELEKLPGGYPLALDSIGPGALGKYRKYYRSVIANYLGNAKPALIVDKMPLRLMQAGLITRLFPRARILFVLRHPCDVVLSNFMQNYAVSEATIHFDSLQHCAQMYDMVMRLWQQAELQLTLRLEYVRYEALIEDTGAALDQVCTFLGISREDTQTHEQARLLTRERVRSASYQQVAEPIYQRAAGRWTRYRRHLDPHIPILMQHIRHFGYAVED